MYTIHAESIQKAGDRQYIIFHGKLMQRNGWFRIYHYPFVDEEFRNLFREWTDENIPLDHPTRPRYSFHSSSVRFHYLDDALMAYLRFR